MKKLAAIIAACACAYSCYGQGGFPYSGTTNTTWDSFIREWKPIISWYSGLTERAAVVGITSPPSVNQTWTVATNMISAVDVVTNIEAGVTNVYYFTNRITVGYGNVTVSNLLPVAYDIAIDGAVKSATCFPVLTQSVISNLDKYQDVLYPAFCSTSIYHGGSYNYWMDRWTNSIGTGLAWLVYGAAQTPNSKAQAFIDANVGKVANQYSNSIGWVTNGTALWAAPIKGFTGGGLRLGSVNAERVYIASGFPVAGGIDFNGVYAWVDSFNWTPYALPVLISGGLYKNATAPNPVPPDYGDIQNCAFYDATPAMQLLLGSASSYDVGWWYYWYYWGNVDFYFDGFARASSETNWFAWVYGDGKSTNPVTGTISNSIAWNYRAGGSWTDPHKNPIACQWWIDDGQYVLMYKRAQTSAYESLSIGINGTAFNSQDNGAVGYSVTSATVSISTPSASVPVWFAGVTNMTATGIMSDGDSVTLWATNRTLYTANAQQWGTLNKKAIDERVGAMRAMQWTVKTKFALTAINSNFWQGHENYNINSEFSADMKSCYDYAAANIVEGWTNSYGGIPFFFYHFPALPESEGNCGSAFIKKVPGFGYECGISIIRKFYTYALTNLNTSIPHSVDVVMNVSDNQGGYWSDIPGASIQGSTFIYTNFPSSTNSGHSFTLRPLNTGAPSSNEYPSFLEWSNSASTVFQKGFQAPRLQAVIKWETAY